MVLNSLEEDFRQNNVSLPDSIPYSHLSFYPESIDHQLFKSFLLQNSNPEIHKNCPSKPYLYLNRINHKVSAVPQIDISMQRHPKPNTAFDMSQ